MRESCLQGRRRELNFMSNWARGCCSPPGPREDLLQTWSTSGTGNDSGELILTQGAYSVLLDVPDLPQMSIGGVFCTTPAGSLICGRTVYLTTSDPGTGQYCKLLTFRAWIRQDRQKLSMANSCVGRRGSDVESHPCTVMPPASLLEFARSECASYSICSSERSVIHGDRIGLKHPANGGTRGGLQCEI